MTQTQLQTYEELLKAIRSVQAASKKRVEQAIDREKVREAWETGKLIDAHVLQHKERAEFGKQVIDRLAADLGISDTELGLCLQFARAYPIDPPAGRLSWAHYRELLSLNEIETREEVALEAVRRHWSRDRLREEVRRRQSKVAVKSDRVLIVRPGKVYTYRIIKTSAGEYRGQLGVDLGFSTYFQPDGINRFKEGEWVAIENGGLKKAAGGEEELFTYHAYVTQIIDGDTFHALIDLGFKIVTEQKLRLAGLDASIVESSDGREAKEFLEKMLFKNGGQILIKTTKSDKYDRYLADVWADGKWINQELIDNGLAVRMGD